MMTLIGMVANAQETSVAGFYPLNGSGRIVYNFNPGWRFHLGDVAHGEATTLDDSRWEVVSAPHTSRLEPAEVSGSRNYQGISWYRKTFVMPDEMGGKQVELHFEAIMGKQQVYVNGRLVTENKGGYLPIIVNLTEQGVKAGDTCLIAVKADNSDDKDYPPGKKQTQLDFSYHGGMYRDVWLIGKSGISITDALQRNQVAGGGVFIHYSDITDQRAQMFVNVEIGNADGRKSKPVVVVRVKDADGKVVEVLCEYDPDSRGGDPADGRKVKGATLHWVDAHNCLDAEIRLYENLFSDPQPDGPDKNFLEALNPDSLHVLHGCKVESSMREVAEAFDKKENRSAQNSPTFQFMRVGFFCLDNKDSSADHLVFNRSVLLKDGFKK